jgi:hypothetical protein
MRRRCAAEGCDPGLVVDVATSLDLILMKAAKRPSRRMAAGNGRLFQTRRTLREANAKAFACTEIKYSFRLFQNKNHF